MKSITIRMDDELHKQLKMTTVEEGTSIQDYIITLIQDSLNVTGKKTQK